MDLLQDLRITVKAFSETPFAPNKSQTTFMPLTLTCCVGVASEGWLAASVADGNMSGGQDGPPSFAEDGEPDLSGLNWDGDYTV